MLRGSYNANIDEKGRVRIPAAFRRYLDDEYGATEFYVTSLTGESVLVYPMPEWERIEAKLALLPAMEPAKKKFLDRTNFYGQASAVDPQGRIVIPPYLRGSAELLGEVTVFGYLTYMEVWSADRFRTRLDAAPYTEADAEALARLGI